MPNSSLTVLLSADIKVYFAGRGLNNSASTALLLIVFSHRRKFKLFFIRLADVVGSFLTECTGIMRPGCRNIEISLKITDRLMKYFLIASCCDQTRLLIINYFNFKFTVTLVPCHLYFSKFTISHITYVVCVNFMYK